MKNLIVLLFIFIPIFVFSQISKEDILSDYGFPDDTEEQDQFWNYNGDIISEDVDLIYDFDIKTSFYFGENDNLSAIIIQGPNNKIRARLQSLTNWDITDFQDGNIYDCDDGVKAKYFYEVNYSEIVIY